MEEGEGLVSRLPSNPDPLSLREGLARETNYIAMSLGSHTICRTMGSTMGSY